MQLIDHWGYDKLTWTPRSANRLSESEQNRLTMDACSVNRQQKPCFFRWMNLPTVASGLHLQNRRTLGRSPRALEISRG